MSNSAPLKYMRCIASTAARAPIRTGTYSPIIGFDGSAPNRTAIIVDAWGASHPVREDEDGRWQLFVRDDDDPVAELLFV
jgi:hypothetical protein